MGTLFAMRSSFWKFHGKHKSAQVISTWNWEERYFCCEKWVVQKIATELGLLWYGWEPRTKKEKLRRRLSS